jgi:glutathione S-transferase
MPDYTLYGTPRSRAFRVLWMLHELELPFNHHPEPPQSAAVRAVHPGGKIPVLVADGTPISDSSAILTYLVDRHGGLTHPAGTLDRARQDALHFRILDEIDALLWTAARHSFVLPEAERVPAIKDSLKTEFTRNAARLADDLGAAPFLMGDTLSLPDIVLGHCLGWAKLAKFPALPDPLAADIARLRARPPNARAAA